MHHTAHHFILCNRGTDAPTRVYAFKRRVAQRCNPVSKPPWHAIHRWQYDGIGTKQWCNVLRHCRQRRPFDGDDNDILYA